MYRGASTSCTSYTYIIKKKNRNKHSHDGTPRHPAYELNTDYMTQQHKQKTYIQHEQ